jgi:hypothetical protein
MKLLPYRLNKIEHARVPANMSTVNVFLGPSADVYEALNRMERSSSGHISSFLVGDIQDTILRTTRESSQGFCGGKHFRGVAYLEGLDVMEIWITLSTRSFSYPRYYCVQCGCMDELEVVIRRPIDIGCTYKELMEPVRKWLADTGQDRFITYLDAYINHQ